MKYFIGEVYFYKNGQRFSEKIYISAEKLNKIKVLYNNSRFATYGDEESELLIDTVDVEKVYSRYLDDGYSILRYSKKINITDEEVTITDKYCLECCIADTIDQTTAQILERDYKSVSNSELVEDNYFKVLQQRDGIKYFDYQFKDPVNTIEYFLKEKTNNLTDEERIMFDKYRNYNLEEILAGDFTGVPVQHYNGGVIIISDNDIFKSSCKGYQHNLEFNVYFDNANLNINCSKCNMFEMIGLTKYIFVQLAKNCMTFWIPQNINKHQLEQLEMLRDEVINYTGVEVIGYVINNNLQEIKNISDLSEFIEIKKEELAR